MKARKYSRNIPLVVYDTYITRYEATTKVDWWDKRPRDIFMWYERKIDCISGINVNFLDHKEDFRKKILVNFFETVRSTNIYRFNFPFIKRYFPILQFCWRRYKPDAMRGTRVIPQEEWTDQLFYRRTGSTIGRSLVSIYNEIRSLAEIHDNDERMNLATNRYTIYNYAIFDKIKNMLQSGKDWSEIAEKLNQKDLKTRQTIPEIREFYYRYMDDDPFAKKADIELERKEKGKEEERKRKKQI